MFTKSLFNKKDIVAVALSGGKDSVCLLHLLITHALNLGITVKAINVEHGIRGASSLSDSQFVKDLCKKFNVELKTYSVNVPLFASQNGFSEEQAARILRYECFDNALIDGFCNKIATAHHSDDNAETVLFNLFRGSALSGVCGIKEISENGKIIRPLLNCTREQIEEYVKQNNLPFVHDETNDLTNYSRNYIRKEIMPVIASRFNGAKKAINRFSSLASLDEKLLCNLAENLIDGNSVTFTDELNLPLFNRACLKVMQKLGITKDFESVHLTALYNLKHNQTGKRIELKKGVVAYKSRNKVVFEKQEETKASVYSITIPCKIETARYTVVLEKVDQMQGDGLFFDKDKLPKNAVLRFRNTGDTITAFGGKTKTLKKFFNDKKIDARISKNMPIIAMENRVLAVCPIDISEDIKVDETTKDIIKITCLRKGE